MSKKIGIKLADGSFYPILEEGTPDKKTLELTTVKDNQKTVQVDLYRSETGRMEDAEYVDSLEMNNLFAHPNGEPSLSFDIKLDENNELSAEMTDPESGKKINVEAKLVNRTEQERDLPANFELSPNEPETSNADEMKPSSGLLAAAVAKKDETEEVPESFDLPNDFNEPIIEEPVAETEPLNLEAAEIPEEEKPAEEDLSLENNASDDAFSFDSLDLPKFDDIEDSKPESLDNVEEKPVEDVSASSDLLVSDLPNIDFDDDTTKKSVDDFSNEKVSFDEPEVVTTDKKNEENDNFFNLPDFDDDEFEPSKHSDSFAAEEAKDEMKESLNSDELTSMDFDSFADDSLKNIDLSEEEKNIDFSNFNDNEISDSEVEKEVKKTKKHVVICVVCAIICIIATILILFILPSRLNLLNKDIQENNVVPLTPSVSEQKLPPPELPKAPEAKENEIVISPTPQVVPVAPVEAPKETKNITYKIRWGDTLWDISDAYYRNPWKYNKIANYNQIKNPDHIISGTTIVIPAE